VKAAATPTPAHVPSLAKWLEVSAFVLAIALPAGCGRSPVGVVRLATTTSTADTGLLDVLTEAFLKDTGIRVDFIVTGTGQALAHGRNGDVDAVMVHAPEAEELFVREGYGLERIPLMWNDFVISGPPEDPAAISGARDAGEALARVSEAQATFISRGDDSGTHKKELQLWEVAGLEPHGAWYVEAGQGMGACLTMAHEMRAYLLTDRGTYLARSHTLDLEILFEGGDKLVNPYAIIAVDPGRFPSVKYADVQRLIRWLVSSRGQSLIEEYRVDGHQLFHLFAKG
jgi:tungstate transport system substrate-binding protein